MNELAITISAEKYDELVRKAERIEVVKKVLGSDLYVTLEDVRIILDIKKKEAKEDEAV